MTFCACVGSQILCSRLPGGVLVLVVHVELEVVQRGLERRHELCVCVCACACVCVICASPQDGDGSRSTKKGFRTRGGWRAWAEIPIQERAWERSPASTCDAGAWSRWARWRSWSASWGEQGYLRSACRPFPSSRRGPCCPSLLYPYARGAPTAAIPGRSVP